MRVPPAALAALAALALWHVALRRHALDLPMISDEGEYAYEARLLKEGGVPYRDAYNQKPPVVFWLYRLSYGLFGESPRSPRILAAFFCWGAMGLLFAMTPAGWSWSGRLAAPAAYAALSTLPVGDMGFTANTEVFLAGFAALSAWALSRALGGEGGTASGRGAPGWALASGLAAGAAVMTKQTALWTVLAFGVLAGWEREGRLRRAGAYAAGLAVVPAAFLAAFSLQGAVRDFLEQAFSRNMDYAAVVYGFGAARSQTVWLAQVLAPKLLWGGWPAAALAAYGLCRSSAGGAGSSGVLAAAWLGAGLTGVATGLWFFPHYFLQALPPLALSAALGIERVAEHRPLAAHWLAAALAVYPALAHARIYFREPPAVVARRLLYPNPLYESVEIAEHIRRRAAPGDTLYVFGSEPQIYVYAGLRAATRHIYVYPLTLFPKDAASVERELADLARARPRFIVYVNQPASTLVVSRLGDRFRNGILEMIGRGYRWVGEARVRPEGGLAAFWSDDEPSAELPDWRASDRLYLFERLAAEGNR